LLKILYLDIQNYHPTKLGVIFYVPIAIIYETTHL
jgi:hypothetical protein